MELGLEIREQSGIVGADPVDAERREALRSLALVDSPGDHRDADPVRGLEVEPTNVDLKAALAGLG